jgi:undecaprenyl-diphosphatase
MPPDNQQYLNRLRRVVTVLWVAVVLMYLAMAVPDTRGWVQSIDDQILTMAVDAEASPLVGIATLLTFVGGAPVMFPFVMIVAAYLYWKQRKTATLFWLAALAVSEILIWASKLLYAKQRPPMALVATHGYAFPSGHAGTAAVVALGVLLLVAVRRSRHWYLDVIAVAYVVAVAWSRVYLRAHWLSDVFTGAALGTAVAISALLVAALLVQHGGKSAFDRPKHPRGLHPPHGQ